MLLLFLSLAFSMCGPWSDLSSVGVLNGKLLEEASGLAILNDTMYHINDSGDGSYFYSSNLAGKNTQKIEVKGIHLFDQEAIALTKCNAGKDCLVIGDIGDNYRARDSIDFYFIVLQDIQNNKVNVYHHLKVRYPDTARNAEAFSFDEQGNLILLSKEGFDSSKTSKDAIVYKLDKSHLFSKKQEMLKILGRLPIHQWTQDKYWLANLITDFSIHNGYWYILTYRHILILKPSKNISDKNQLCHKINFLKRDLAQAEALSVYKDSLYVTTEARKNHKTQKIMTWTLLEAKAKDQK